MDNSNSLVVAVAKYVPGKLLADTLSHLQIKAFRELHPLAEPVGHLCLSYAPMDVGRKELADLL
ncbi:unnamed protein product [Ranitomeya imitator]|uniref:Uncharacterized protein n=1 Tax=Ranitomeya imitator TaxID=111125 RepID=A0ABN9LLA8_9NEOB|nr:unnamed protein product [Ranitomeya imitator]